MTGRELRAIRLRLGLTQAALGEKLDVTRETVGNWECGRLPVKRMAALAVQQLLALSQGRSGRTKGE